MRAPNMSLTNDRTYNARVQMRREQVRTYLDGPLLSTYRGDGSDLSLLESWNLPDSASLGLGAYKSAVTFHRIRVRPAGDLHRAK